MGKLGHGYGSEFHLLRWMGRHRSEFNRRILTLFGKTGCDIEWLDFPFAGTNKSLDSEWKGLNFLPIDSSIKKEWSKFWPTGNGIHNWDLVGKLNGSTRPDWILVEAKAHAREIESDCKAADPDSVEKIGKALIETRQALGADIGRDWTRECYQFANRLAVLWFLRNHHIRAHLLFIYFTGDKRPERNNPAWNPECPIDRDAWEKVLKKQTELLGLPEEHPLAGQIHKLFLPAFVSETPK